MPGAQSRHRRWLREHRTRGARTARLTSPMRRALRRAHLHGLPVDSPGFHRRTIRALRDRGLIHRRRNRKGREMWRATDLGAELLMHRRRQAPSFLHIRSQYGYTTSRGHALFGEPSAIRDDDEERERAAWHRMAA